MRTIDPGNACGLEQGLEMVADILRNPTAEGVTRLVSIGKDAEQAAEMRAAASCAILDLAWGQPAENVEISGADAGLKETQTHA